MTENRSVHDHAKFKNKLMFFATPSSWFIFTLQKKNKQLETAAGLYTYIQMVYEQNAVIVIDAPT